MYANRNPKVETRQRTPVRIDFSECEVLTEQHHKEECDIINIVKKYDKLGMDFEMFTAENCMDITDAPTYLEMQNKIAQANHIFEELPARLRLEFQNSTQNFLEFMSNPENSSRIEELGLSAAHLKKATESPQSDEKTKPVGKDKKSDKSSESKAQAESDTSNNDG
ncbi:internal scaffolding protein [Microviridae sp.]|nr:internal scaffolding protein [Microviridae sp.]